jgi:hypothetical protein
MTSLSSTEMPKIPGWPEEKTTFIQKKIEIETQTDKRQHELSYRFISAQVIRKEKQKIQKERTK